ncbi:hypothetical protein [Pinibacter soli]|uniref:Lipoprotein n=1 Tax=Pinibacter soli TaxID=3044211 RepID=A0ABT6RLL1_9BACT|nr:hypothetical protein [Pinibacter soli]MDI3322739.1 hypothetical protein [Pinibacter soli]
MSNRIGTAAIIIIAVIVNICCKEKKNRECLYTLDNLLKNDSPRAVVVNSTDTLTEVRDLTKDNSSGLYVFDKNKNLKLYAFLRRDSVYKYLEEYDSKGQLIKKEGSPLIEYRIWKIDNNDSLLFNVSLFALNKKYEDIKLVTNIGDTIRPVNLYKSPFYTNVKVFPFKVSKNKIAGSLIIYAQISFENLCTYKKELVYDTTYLSDDIH